MSSFNSLQVSAQKRFLNPGDARAWYLTSNTDYPQSLSAAGIYELPFGRNKPFFAAAPSWVDEIIRGFQVEGTYRIGSGQPLTFSNAAISLAPGQTLPNINAPSIHNYKQWFNTHALLNVNDATAAGINYANNEALVSNLRTFPLRFNNVRQDYINLLNVGAQKKFQVYKERVNMDVRAESINALNHQVYTNPNTDPSSTSFGVIGGPSGSWTARILQFAVEAHF